MLFNALDYAYLYRMNASQSTKASKSFDGMAGQFLVAMPGMGDDRFTNSVILMTNHDEDGAMGFIINKPQDIQMSDLLVQLEMVDDERAANLPLSVNQVGCVTVGLLTEAVVLSFIQQITHYVPHNGSPPTYRLHPAWIFSMVSPMVQDRNKRLWR